MIGCAVPIGRVSLDDRAAAILADVQPAIVILYHILNAMEASAKGHVAAFSFSPAQPAGDIMVTRSTDPGWTPIFGLLGGLIMESGGSCPMARGWPGSTACRP